MYKDKGDIKRNTNMLLMKRFIDSKMLKSMEIPKMVFSNTKKAMDVSYSLIQKHIHSYTMFHSYSVLASNYKGFYLMTPIVWNKSGIFKNVVDYIRPFINNLLTIIYYKHE